MGTIFNIQKFCIHDGDGIRTNVFLKGCPLRCIWCHNPEGLDRERNVSFFAERCTGCGRCLEKCPGRTIDENGVLHLDRSKCTLCGSCVEACLNKVNEIMGYEATAEEVFADVMKDKMFYDTTGGGMTISGGEPSYQAEFAMTLLRMGKEAGIGLAIESCGIGKREFYAEAADLGATFLFDMKCMDSYKHKALTGVSNDHIIDNLLYLFERGADVRIRMPMIPGCNDSDEDIAKLSAFLKEHEGKYKYAEIMPYHALGVGKSDHLGKDVAFRAENATDADIARWVGLFERNGVKVRVSK
ncbi:MAG: glycyl-radical enzyme activating protein, partial [Clostridia bacterium]|nr:glycyl-radical enzyme activating protein [Clostridia bacterium]